MSDDDSLPSVDPATLIPGLQRHSVPIYNPGVPSDSNPSDIPSVFEDTELTAERIRYLHAKHVRESILKEREEKLEEVADNDVDEFVFLKRKWVTFEIRYNQAEADEESAVLSHLRKKKKKRGAATSYM